MNRGKKLILFRVKDDLTEFCKTWVSYGCVFSLFKANYIIFDTYILRPLNYQNDQNFADKPVVHSQLQAFVIS